MSARLSFLSAFPLMMVDSQGSRHLSQLLCCFLCLPVVPLNCAHVPPITPQKVIFNLDHFSDQFSSTNTVLAQLARMNWGGTRGKTGGSGSNNKSCSPGAPAQESPLLPSHQPTNFPGEWKMLVISQTIRFFFFFLPLCCLKEVFNCHILYVGIILSLTS